VPNTNHLVPPTVFAPDTDADFQNPDAWDQTLMAVATANGIANVVVNVMRTTDIRGIMPNLLLDHSANNSRRLFVST
jgi:hypothetical protein